MELVRYFSEVRAAGTAGGISEGGFESVVDTANDDPGRTYIRHSVGCRVVERGFRKGFRIIKFTRSNFIGSVRYRHVNRRKRELARC